MSEDTNPNELLLPATAAVILKLSPKTLEQWRWRGLGPKFLKCGRFVRYRRSDIDDWLSGRIVSSAREGRSLEAQGASI